jgi:hypothetical protein
MVHVFLGDAVGVLKQYVPLIGAAAYLVYIAAEAYQSGNTSQISTAVLGLLAALGYGSATAAHTKIDAI